MQGLVDDPPVHAVWLLTWRGYPTSVGKKTIFSSIALWIKQSFPHLFPNPTLDASSLNTPSLFCTHKPKHTSNTLKSLHRILSDKSHVGSAFMSSITVLALYFKMYVSHSACVGSEWAAYSLSWSHAACMARRGERRELLFWTGQKAAFWSIVVPQLPQKNPVASTVFGYTWSNPTPSKLWPQFSNSVS